MCIRDRQHIARDGPAVHSDDLHAVLDGGGIVHRDVVHRAPEAAGDCKAAQRVGNAGVHLQAVQHGVKVVTVDGRAIAGNVLPLAPAGTEVAVRVTMG